MAGESADERRRPRGVKSSLTRENGRAFPATRGARRRSSATCVASGVEPGCQCRRSAPSFVLRCAAGVRYSGVGRLDVGRRDGLGGRRTGDAACRRLGCRLSQSLVGVVGWLVAHEAMLRNAI